MKRRFCVFLIIALLLVFGGSAMAEDAQSDYRDGMVLMLAEEYEQAYRMFVKAGRYKDAAEYRMYCEAVIALNYALTPDELAIKLTNAQRVGDSGLISTELLELAVLNLDLLAKSGFMKGEKTGSANLLAYAQGRLAEANDSLYTALEYYYACPVIYDVKARIERINNIIEYLPTIKVFSNDGEEVTIRWNAVDKAKNYDVFVCGEAEGAYEFEGSVKKTEYTWEMDESRFDQVYFKVRAVYENSFKPASLSKRYGDALNAWQSDMKASMPDTDAGIGRNVTPLSKASEPVLVVSQLDKPVITNVALNNGQIQVSWLAVKDAKSYNILRDGSIVELDSRRTIYSDKDFIYGKTYRYQIVAQHENALRNSPPSDKFEYRPVLPAPTDVRVYLDSNGNIQITWNKVDNADRYSVYRLNHKNNKEIRVSDSGGLSYTDRDIDEGVTYSYSVTASSGSHESARSSKKQVTTKYNLVAPALKASVSGNNVTLSWKGENSATGYEIYRSSAENAKGNTIANLGKTETYADKNLNTGVYYYSICSKNGNQYSERSAQVRVQILPGAVSINLIADRGNGKVELSWKAAQGATSYAIYRNGKRIDTVTSTRYYDNVSVGQEYRYKVAAVAGGVEGAAGAERTCYTALSISSFDKKRLSVSESSHLAGNPTEIVAKNLFDGSINTAWCEGVAGYYGEWVEASTGSTKYWVSGVKIINGFRQDRFWDLNSRVKKLEVWCDDTRITTLSLMDSKKEQTFYLPDPVLCSKIRFVITDIYEVYDPGDKTRPCVCLNEITLF